MELTNEQEIEKQFSTELNFYKNEVLLVLKSLYIELAIHGIASTDAETLKSLNLTPTFWNTILNSLQHSTFITLGRIFDVESSHHSIHTLKNLVESNFDALFSKESFRKRWLSNPDKQGMINALDEYEKNIHVPTRNEFKIFKKYISKRCTMYLNTYSDIRIHFAHKIYVTSDEIKPLFDKVLISDLEKFCMELYSIYEVLFQLYHNGRGSLLPNNEKNFSTQEILNTEFRTHRTKPPNAQFVDEVVTLLDLLNRGRMQKMEDLK